MTKISIRNARFAKIGLQDMLDYIGDTADFIMAEIGSYVGDSTEIFAKKVCLIYCIDPWKNGYDNKDGASENIEMSIIEKQFDKLKDQYKNIIKHKCSSEVGVEFFEDNSLDLVYIDGLHTYDGCKQDIDLWLPKVKKGGYIAGHDYGSRHFPGVQKAVDEVLIPDATFRDSSWIKRV